MIDVFICEDDLQQLVNLKGYIENYIMIENLDMQVIKAVTQPEPLLDDLNEQHECLYFLDIDLGTKLNGIELAKRIRTMLVDCKLVFVTTHAELALETLQYQLEPLAFILKDDPDSIQAQVIQAIELARLRWKKSKSYQHEYLEFKTDDKIRAVRSSDILYFETAAVPHKLVVHLANAHFEIYSSVKAASGLSSNFFRCDKSIVVNKKQVQQLNRKQRVVMLSNGESVPCSVMGGRNLAQQFKKEKSKQ